jgi:hypothetical protein
MMFTGNIWFMLNNRQQALIKDEELESFAAGTLCIEPNDPRTVAFDVLEARIDSIEEVLMRGNHGEA